MDEGKITSYNTVLNFFNDFWTFSTFLWTSLTVIGWAVQWTPGWTSCIKADKENQVRCLWKTPPLVSICLTVGFDRADP